MYFIFRGRGGGGGVGEESFRGFSEFFPLSTMEIMGMTRITMVLFKFNTNIYQGTRIPAKNICTKPKNVLYDLLDLPKRPFKRLNLRSSVPSALPNSAVIEANPP